MLLVGHVKGGDTRRKSSATSAMRGRRAIGRRCGRCGSPRSSAARSSCFVDTPAAYPGIESEERGVAEAIAVNLRDMMVLDTPVIVIVSGEGGSGGALGIAVGDRVLMQEHAIYSVIPPEGAPRSCGATRPRRSKPHRPWKLTRPICWRPGSSTRARRSRLAVRTPILSPPPRTSTGASAQAWPR